MAFLFPSCKNVGGKGAVPNQIIFYIFSLYFVTQAIMVISEDEVARLHKANRPSALAH